MKALSQYFKMKPKTEEFTAIFASNM